MSGAKPGLITSQSRAHLWNACVAAAESAGYEVLSADRKAGVLRFNTGRPRWLWTMYGQDVEVRLLVKSRAGYETHMTTNIAIRGWYSGQSFDWGEGRRVLERYSQAVKELLASSPIPTERKSEWEDSPNYWATGNYDPERYYRETGGMSREYRDYVENAYGDLDTYEANRPD